MTAFFFTVSSVMLSRSLRSLAVAAGLGMVLVGCAPSAPPLQQLPEMTFRTEAPLKFKVARVEVISQYRPTGQPPHIEHDMPVAPENAIKRWVQDRIAPTGRTQTLRVLVRNAEATETPLKTDQTMTGLFKREQAARIHLNIDVALQILDERQFVIAEIADSQDRTATTPENQKLNERDRLLYNMVQEMVTAFDQKIKKNAPEYLGNWMDYR